MAPKKLKGSKRSKKTTEKQKSDETSLPATSQNDAVKKKSPPEIKAGMRRTMHELAQEPVRSPRQRTRKATQEAKNNANVGQKGSSTATATAAPPKKTAAAAKTTKAAPKKKTATRKTTKGAPKKKATTTNPTEGATTQGTGTERRPTTPPSSVRNTFPETAPRLPSKTPPKRPAENDTGLEPRTLFPGAQSTTFNQGLHETSTTAPTRPSKRLRPNRAATLAAGVGQNDATSNLSSDQPQGEIVGPASANFVPIDTSRGSRLNAQFRMREDGALEVGYEHGGGVAVECGGFGGANGDGGGGHGGNGDTHANTDPNANPHEDDLPTDEETEAARSTRGNPDGPVTPEAPGAGQADNDDEPESAQRAQHQRNVDEATTFFEGLGRRPPQSEREYAERARHSHNVAAALAFESRLQQGDPGVAPRDPGQTEAADNSESVLADLTLDPGVAEQYARETEFGRWYDRIWEPAGERSEGPWAYTQMHEFNQEVLDGLVQFQARAPEAQRARIGGLIADYQDPIPLVEQAFADLQRVVQRLGQVRHVGTVTAAMLVNQVDPLSQGPPMPAPYVVTTITSTIEATRQAVLRQMTAPRAWGPRVPEHQAAEIQGAQEQADEEDAE